MDKKTMMRSSVPRRGATPVASGGGAVSFFLNLFESIERREYQFGRKTHTSKQKNDWRNVGRKPRSAIVFGVPAKAGIPCDSDALVGI